MSSDRHARFLERFPETLEFPDATGRRLAFRISGAEGEGGGYAFAATELRREGGAGYYFRAYSDCSPMEAFVALTSKVRDALSVRHLDRSQPGTNLLNDVARGRVVDGGVVVDGEFVAFSSLVELMQTYDGWDFHLRFDS
jgi:hypothetical protein